MINRYAIWRIAVGLVIVGGATACSETQPVAPADSPIDFAAANTIAACPLLADVTNNAKAYFSMPDRESAVVRIAAMGVECGNGIQSATTAIAWEVVGLIETALEADRGGDPSIGSNLVNGLLGCVNSLCATLPSPSMDFGGALASQGLFAVRSQSTHPAVSREAVQFSDLRGTTIDGYWGVEVDLPWAQVTFADPVLIFGRPLTSNGVPLTEASIGNVQYQLDVYPDAGEFLDGALHVSACFSPDAVYDDGTNPFDPRLQREQVLLELHVPGFCGTVFSRPAAASILGSVLAMADTYVVEPLLALFRADKKAPAVGGTPLDFSRFAPVAANTDGHLEFVTEPDPRPSKGQPIGNVQVRALSGANTPIEKVLVTLYIQDNRGIPAGAVLSGDLSALTEERIGVQGIATLGNVRVGKPGGYLICATGSSPGYTFPDVCAKRINVKNK